MVNELIIEVAKGLGQRHCAEAFASGGEMQARTIPPELDTAGAQAWALELSRLLDEQLAAELRAVKAA